MKRNFKFAELVSKVVVPEVPAHELNEVQRRVITAVARAHE